MKQKKYWIAGLAGAVCFGIGDWLLGFVDPTPLGGGLSAGAKVFYFIRAGHGGQYAGWRNIAAVVLAMFGICFYLPAFRHMADVIKAEKFRKALKYIFGLCAAGWMIVHLLVIFHVEVFHDAFQSAGLQAAEQISGKLAVCSGFALYPAYLLIAVPLLVLSALILAEQTVLRKMAICFSPLVWMLIWFTAAQEMPASPFSYGLYTFCMNGGMLVWFLYLLTRKTPTNVCDIQVNSN